MCHLYQQIFSSPDTIAIVSHDAHIAYRISHSAYEYWILCIRISSKYARCTDVTTYVLKQYKMRKKRKRFEATVTETLLLILVFFMFGRWARDLRIFTFCYLLIDSEWSGNSIIDICWSICDILTFPSAIIKQRVCSRLNSFDVEIGLKQCGSLMKNVIDTFHTCIHFI